VLRTSDGSEFILSSVCFKDHDMWVEVQPVGEEGDPEELLLSELGAKAPQMVGITFGPNDDITIKDIERGYIALKEPKKGS
jgi:hypothetical protein